MTAPTTPTVAQTAVLQALMDAGRATASDLVQDVGYHRPWTMAALRSLQGECLVRRLAMRDRDGAVAWHYSLTPQGISLALQATTVH